MENKTIIIAIFASIMGIIGSILGVINFIIGRDKDRLKLKVFPTFITSLESAGEKSKIVSRIGIEIINLSDFPVSIRDVGFLSKKYKNPKLQFFDKKIVGGGGFPKRMEPKTAIRVHHPNPNLFKNTKEIKGAYAITECGKEIQGKNNKLIKQFRSLTKQST